MMRMAGDGRVSSASEALSSAAALWLTTDHWDVVAGPLLLRG